MRRFVFKASKAYLEIHIKTRLNHLGTEYAESTEIHCSLI